MTELIRVIPHGVRRHEFCLMVCHLPYFVVDGLRMYAQMHGQWKTVLTFPSSRTIPCRPYLYGFGSRTPP